MSSERRLEALLATADELVWECDPSSVITFVSHNVVDYLGYEPADLIGRRAMTLVHPADRVSCEDRLGAVCSGNTDGWRHEQARWIAKDGTETWLDSNAVVNRGADGTVLGLYGASRHLDTNLAMKRHREELAGRILHVLMRRDVTAVFQPIVCLNTGRILGAEALSRFAAEPQQSPDRWFSDAAQVGLAAELELLCVRIALDRATTAIPDDAYLSLNLSPTTMTSPELMPLLTGSGLPPERLVLEITEHMSVDDYESFADPLAQLRALGMRLAVDDAGAGYSSFRHILRLAPDFIKLDRGVIAGMDTDPARRALAAAVVMFALEVGSTVVAEGIETVAELHAAQLLGIDAAQGYLMARPAPDHSDWPPIRQVDFALPHETAQLLPHSPR